MKDFSRGTKRNVCVFFFFVNAAEKLGEEEKIFPALQQNGAKLSVSQLLLLPRCSSADVPSMVSDGNDRKITC